MKNSFIFILPSHLNPLPVKPERHVHQKDPAVLVHRALTSQLWIFFTHSSISEKKNENLLPANYLETPKRSGTPFQLPSNKFFYYANTAMAFLSPSCLSLNWFSQWPRLVSVTIRAWADCIVPRSLENLKSISSSLQYCKKFHWTGDWHLTPLGKRPAREDVCRPFSAAFFTINPI